MQQLSVPVPDEFVASNGGEDAAKELISKLIVLEMLRRHEISTGRAASMLGMNRWDFADLAAEHNIPTFELLTGETMEEHVRMGRELFKRMRAE